MKVMATNKHNVDLAVLTPAALAELPDREFRAVVDADLKRGATGTAPVPAWISTALRGPLVERWLAALQAALANVDSQIDLKERSCNVHVADVTSEIEAQKLRTECERSLLGPRRFRGALLEIMPEAVRLREGRVRLLEAAIRAHRDVIEADASVGPSLADETLWSFLND